MTRQEREALDKKENERIYEPEIQEQIDSNVLWALLRYCMIMGKDSKGKHERVGKLLGVLADRRMEFSRKCASN